ncbi:hypothetical protein PHMEG_00038879, partial [Phytophthora megakarya]
MTRPAMRRTCSTKTMMKMTPQQSWRGRSVNSRQRKRWTRLQGSRSLNSDRWARSLPSAVNWTRARTPCSG